MNFTSDLIRTLQRRLSELRYYFGKVDGDAGVYTLNALSRFKSANRLKARPFPGPLTMASLWASTAIPAPRVPQAKGEPSWLTEARSLIGTKEFPGTANNPVLMSMAKNLDQWYPGDDVPWCGLFVAHCMAAGAPEEPQNFNRLGARNWLEYGQETNERLGSIAVFWRTHKTNSWNGHVGLLTGVADTAIRIIGGNQSDSVSEIWMPKSRLLGYRGPSDWSGIMAPISEVGKMSTRES